MRGVVILFVLVCSLCFISAEVNLTQQQITVNCINDSIVAIESLSVYNISLIRFNDSLTTAQQLYEAQAVLEANRKKTNYDTAISYCNQIIELKNTAIEALDSYGVFLSFYNETTDSNVETPSVDIIIAQIDAEIAGERYENVMPLLDQAYDEVSRIKSDQTAITLAYSVATKGVGEFIKSNWIFLVSIVVLLLMFYLLYRTKISLWLLNRKMNSLLLRKDTLKKLMSEAQKDYFQSGKIPESEYRIKIKNFGELVRDIDRQVPLIQQDIARYSFATKQKLKEKDKERLKSAR